MPERNIYQLHVYEASFEASVDVWPLIQFEETISCQQMWKQYL